MLAVVPKITITREEIKDWINFEYENLLKNNVMIGWFYFTFDQLDDFLYILIKMEQKINKLTNEMNIKTQLITNPLLKLPTTRLEQSKKAIKQEADFITAKIDVINKFNQKTKLSVNYDELNYVYKRLSYIRDEIEHFKRFLLEELETAQDNELSCFFTFINDICSDIKQKIREEIK